MILIGSQEEWDPWVDRKKGYVYYFSLIFMWKVRTYSPCKKRRRSDAVLYRYGTIVLYLYCTVQLFTARCRIASLDDCMD